MPPVSMGMKVMMSIAIHSIWVCSINKWRIRGVVSCSWAMVVFGFISGSIKIMEHICGYLFRLCTNSWKRTWLPSGSDRSLVGTPDTGHQQNHCKNNVFHLSSLSTWILLKQTVQSADGSIYIVNSAANGSCSTSYCAKIIAYFPIPIHMSIVIIHLRFSCRI